MAKKRRARLIRYQGNRMMIELILGRQLTSAEARKVFDNSSKEREVSLWGFSSKLDLKKLNLKGFTGS